MGKLRRWLVVAALVLGAGTLLGAAGGASVLAASSGEGVSMKQSSGNYTVQLNIGPVQAMLTPDQAKTAKSGEVVADMPQATVDSINDSRLPVNHHLEVQILNTKSGEPASDVTPVVTLRNDATGLSYTLDGLMSMYDVSAGPKDTHFGKNVYLPASSYTVTVAFGHTRTVFEGVNIAAGAGS